MHLDNLIKEVMNLMQGISIITKPLQSISLDAECKLTISQNSAEITVLKYKPHDFKCLKLSGSTYLNQRTGEVLDYSSSDDNTKSLDSMRKTFKRLNHLIIDNFSGGQSEVFMTLGYEYQMSDTTQLSHDFNLFWRKLKRRYKECEYISVAEYKGNRSLHLHILIKSLSNKKLFLERDLSKTRFTILNLLMGGAIHRPTQSIILTNAK